MRKYRDGDRLNRSTNIYRSFPTFNGAAETGMAERTRSKLFQNTQCSIAALISKRVARLAEVLL